ncbi:MAG: PAS domain S-box protein [Desulfobacterales bacterium]|nr:PAS domain S-box protein [Desulfobacterales bacterium]
MDDPDKTQEWIVEDLQDLLGRISDCERRYQTLIETNLYGIQIIDIHGKLTYINAAQCNLLGYNIDELEGKEIWGFLASEADRKGLTEYLTNLAKEDRTSEPWTGNYIKKNKKIIQLNNNWTCMRNELKNVKGFISITTGIAGQGPMYEESQENSQIQENDEIYRLIAESAREIIIAFDMFGRIIFANKMAAEVTGYFEEELADMKISDIVPIDQLEVMKKKLMHKHAVESKEAVLNEVGFISRNLNLVPVETSSSLILKNDSPHGILIIAHSLVRRRKMEKELLKAHKFESITTFANGIVNDLQDSLTVISGNIDFAQMSVKPGGSIYKSLADARQVCLEIKELARQFVNFSKRGITTLKTGYLARFIRKVATKALAGTNIEGEFSASDEIRLTDFDEAQIKIITENLIANAVEAMSSRGKIRITVQNITIEEGMEEKDMLIADGIYVKISVRDHGIGIPEENIGKIFDPYFTTKKIEIQKGTGLGLTIVYAIVKKHNGYIYVDSKPNTGTTVNIFFPVSENKISEK